MLIDFFPYFGSEEIIAPQYLYLSILNGVVGIYFHLSPAFFSNKIISIFKKSYLFKAYLAFIILCGLSAFFAPNSSLAIVSLTEIVVAFCIFINLSILLYNRFHLLYRILFVVCFFAFLQSFQALHYFVKTVNTSSLIEAFANLKGNTGSINILGASLSIKIPFLLIGIIHFSNWKKYFLTLVFFLALTVIFLTGARTPLISLCLLFFIILFYFLKTDSIKKTRLINCVTLLLPLLLSFFVVTLIFQKNSVSDRYSSISSRMVQISPEEQSAAMRLNYWENTIQMAKNNPVFGIGLGNYRIESIPYEKKFSDSTLISLHAHNDFLEILAETGLVNGLVYFSLFALLFFINLKRFLRLKTKNEETIAILALMLTVVYGVDSFFNFPMYRPTLLVFFCICFALTVINTSDFEEEKTNSNAKIITILLIIIAIITTYFTYFTFKTSQLESVIKKDHIDGRSKGKLTGNEVLNQSPKYPNVFSSSESFSEYAGIYFLREKNYRMALQCFSEARKINPYLGRVDFYTHSVFKAKGNRDSAYHYAKKAYYMRPRNEFYFRKVQSLANDTVSIFKIHNEFTQFRKMASNWKITSIALEKVNYDKTKLVRFIDSGLKEFPKDSVLLNRKRAVLLKNRKQN